MTWFKPLTTPLKCFQQTSTYTFLYFYSADNAILYCNTTPAGFNTTNNIM